MIDAATGADEVLVTQYLLWFNQNVWGVGAEGKPCDRAYEADENAK